MQSKITRYHQTPELHFSICSSNKEIFSKFNIEMKKHGLVGFSDLQGNMHYIVDARKGLPNVFQKVNEVTMQLMEKKFNYVTQKDNYVESIVERLLRKYEFDQKLIGTTFLRYMLIALIEDEALMLSLSNDLYPLIAEKFHCTVEKVSYSIRYIFHKQELKEKKLKQQGIKANFLYEKGQRSSSNRNSLNILVQEAKEMLQNRNK